MSWNRSKTIVCILSLAFCLSIIRLRNYNINAQFEVCKKNIVNPSKTEAKLKEFVNAVESLDGIGYELDNSIKPLDPRFKILSKLPSCDLSKDRIPGENNVSVIMQDFKKCMRPLVEKWRGKPEQLNLEWVEGTKVCDQLKVYKKLNIQGFKNTHETKWAVLPKCKEENIMVTFGIGHDTLAEELLNRTVPNTKFYGVDPIIEPNLQLYTRFGKFFPFAIGQKAGIQRFKILPNQNQKTRKYTWQDVTTIDVIYFLKNIVNLKKIDFMWIDIESGEFEFIKMMNKGGEFEKNDITVCQFNLEVHSSLNKSGEQIFHDFIFTVLEQDRYVFMHSEFTERKVHRMFFINLKSPECVRKFIQ